MSQKRRATRSRAFPATEAIWIYLRAKEKAAVPRRPQAERWPADRTPGPAFPCHFHVMPRVNGGSHRRSLPWRAASGGEAGSQAGHQLPDTDLRYEAPGRLNIRPRSAAAAARRSATAPAAGAIVRSPCR